MKLKFIKQSFQTAAVNAVADLFIGQEKKTATFSIVQGEQFSLLEISTVSAMPCSLMTPPCSPTCRQCRNTIPCP